MDRGGLDLDVVLALLRARQAEMQGMIDSIIAWVGADDEEAMEAAAEAVVEHLQATRRRARKPAQPAAQQSLL